MTVNHWAGTCSIEGCNEPSEWPGEHGNVCQVHWEEYGNRMWWEQVRDCMFATASLKNRKAR